MVEQMGSGITRILNAYPQSIYKFTANFIRITLPFTKGFVEHYASTTQADPQAKVLGFCQESKTRNEIQEYLGLKDREHFRKAILKPLLESGQIAMTIPDKPTSPNQKFYTTNHDLTVIPLLDNGIHKLNIDSTVKPWNDEKSGNNDGSENNE